ncbi:MAG: hypothetical protein HW421_961 [Ignavibacteria bacterium]|nr:hypothetical protein [Ignavibacteria bacterium]
MKKLMILSVVFAAALFIGLGANAQDAAKKDGKTIFVDAKCNMCHFVNSQGIECKKKDTKAPELSAIGKEKIADYFTKYLKKEVDIEGKKHPVSFKGDDADLATLTAWLESLKEEAKPAEPKPAEGK